MVIENLPSSEQEIFYSDQDGQLFFEVVIGLRNGIPFGIHAKVALDMSVDDQMKEMRRAIDVLTAETGVTKLSAALKELLSATKE